MEIIDDGIQPNERVNVKSLREEIGNVLRKILVQLSENIDGLQLFKVEEHPMVGNNRKLVVDSLVRRRGHNTNHQFVNSITATLYFDVYVEWNGGQQFGQIVIDEMQERYVEIVDQIQ